MKYDAKIHHRRSIRLAHYDYSLPGAYFVTICAYGKRCIFGRVVGDQMRENDCGRIVREQWLDTVRIRPEIELDAFTVMPNHLHGVLWVLGPKGEHILWNSGYVIPDPVGPKSLRPNVVPDIVGPSAIVGPKSLRPRPNAVRPYVPRDMIRSRTCRDQQRWPNVRTSSAGPRPNAARPYVPPDMIRPRTRRDQQRWSNVGTSSAGPWPNAVRPYKRRI